MPQRVTARAHASTANLGHGLDFVGLALDCAADRVTAQRGGTGLELEITGRGAAEISRNPEENTGGRAVRALLAAHALREPVRLTIHKGIRPGSGLGSSAASAAAAVLAVAELFGLALTDEQRAGFAGEGERAAAGARHLDNVAAALCGGLVVVGSIAEGLCVRRVPTPAQPAFVIALPEITVVTKAARAALPSAISLREHCRGAAQAALALMAWREGDLHAFGAAIEGSFVDAARAAFIPGFADVAEAARAAGACGVAVSGAGPAVLVVLPDPARSDAVGAAMRSAFTRHALTCEILPAGVAAGAQVIEVEP